MKGKVLLPFAALLFAATPWPAAAQNILPQSFGGWTAASADTNVPAAQVEQLANAPLANGRSDEANILREYGIASGERRAYTHGSQTATVTLYRMTDPSAAFGAFTFIRDPQTMPLSLGSDVAYSAATADRAWLVVGNLVLDVATSGSVSSPASAERKNGAAAITRVADADLTPLATAVASHADHRPYPIIQGFLPLEGLAPGEDRYVVGKSSTISVPAKLRLIPGSEIYILGPLALAQAFPSKPADLHDWLGFSRSAEGMVARYELGGDEKNQEAVVLVALYPTQQVAANQFTVVSKALSVNPDANATNATANAAANGQPAIFGNRSASLIALVTHVESRQVADNLLSQIHYASDVTWNEPSHEATDPSISTIMVGIFEGTGTIVVLAFAAGIGFGGFRLLVKTLLPGRVFDTEAQVEILQLGLTSKPIAGKDFYKLGSS